MSWYGLWGLSSCLGSGLEHIKNVVRPLFEQYSWENALADTRWSQGGDSKLTDYHHHRGHARCPRSDALAQPASPNFMHKEPTQSPQRKHRTRSTQPLTLNNLDQYGYLHSQPQAFSVLLALPSESLTHVTSFLDPHSLLALAQVNKHLHEHVKDENTWHRAFVFQFLGVGAEGDTNGTESLMVRRMESTWRKEYIIRWNLRRYVPNYSGLLCERGPYTHAL